MSIFIVALRNILRNTRRSTFTALSIAVGALAILLFGGYMNSMVLTFETLVVQRTGHLIIFKTGYFEVGEGDPGAYGIEKYQSIIAAIEADPSLGPMVRVATPGIAFKGIAANASSGASTVFIGGGLVGGEQARMREWNAYGLSDLPAYPYLVRDDDPEGGVVGVGLARILGLCAPLRLSDCSAAPTKRDRAAGGGLPPDLKALAELDRPHTTGSDGDRRPQIDLVAATAGGAPNAVSLYVNGTDHLLLREFDAAFVGMPLQMAQTLLYGRGQSKSTSITVQLHRSADLQAAKAGLVRFISDRNLPLEVRAFTETQPTYLLVVDMLDYIFTFIAAIIGVIVLFAVVATMNTSVMERVSEIGTLRALGMRRSAIRRLFLAEGCLLGVTGATLGLVASYAIGTLIDHFGITWRPPLSVEPIAMSVSLRGDALIPIGCWLGLVIVSTLAALLPAGRAAHLSIVDALRHA